MSSTRSHKALEEAKKELKSAQSYMQTGVLKFRFKPDYLSAVGHYGRAADGFRAAGDFDMAIQCYKNRAECHSKLGNPVGAGIDLEKAIKTMSISLKKSKSAASANEKIASMWQDCANFFLEGNSLERASSANLKAGAALADTGKIDEAKKCYEGAISIYHGSDRHVYAVETGKKVLSFLLCHQMYASAMRLTTDLMARFSALRQPHNVHKLILSRIILLLAESDVVRAQQEFDDALNLPEFPTCNEAEGAENLLDAYKNGDDVAVKEVTRQNVFKYLESAVCRVAMEGLCASGTEATSQRTAPRNANEKATKASSPSRSKQNISNDDFGLGGTVKTWGPREGSAAAAALAASEQADEEYCRSSGVSTEHNDANRAALFAMPARNSAPDVSPYKATNEHVDETQRQDSPSDHAATSNDEGFDHAATSDGEDLEGLM